MENKESKSYIERIEIKGLWGRFDVNWTLHPDVNILVGENGTGKSTILRIVDYLANLIKAIAMTRVSQTIVFEDFHLFYLVNLYFLNNKMIEADYNLEHHSLKVSKDGVFLPNISLLQTFEHGLHNDNEWDKKNKPLVKTHLDKELDELITNYLDYQLNQTNKIINKKQNADTVFAKRRYLIDTINHLFKITKKRIDEDENRIAFLLEDGEKLSPFDLSSGEKQLLIILLTVLCQDEKPSILLLDEPEISMHLTWQYELIEIIRALNPNCQLIIVTHSPSIFTDGWNDRVFWIEDICEPIQKMEKV